MKWLETLENIILNDTSYGTEDDALMDSWSYTLSAIVLGIIGFFGFTLNLSVIILMCKDGQLWTPMNIILLNLVVSDFIVAVIGIPFSFMSAIHHKWIFTNNVCMAYAFIMALFGIIAITSLTVLAYDRYRLISFPLSRFKLNKTSAVVGIVCIWLYSLSVTIPPLFGWGEYTHEAAKISCSVNWEVKTDSNTSYIIYLFILGFILPVSIISYSYINIIRTIRQNEDRVRQVRAKGRANRKATIMIGIMIAAFNVAWTPYAIASLIKHFGDADLITPGLAVIPALFAKSSICYNPIIYVGMNSQFKKSWKRMFRRTDIEMETGRFETQATAADYTTGTDIPKKITKSTTFITSDAVDVSNRNPTETLLSHESPDK